MDHIIRERRDLRGAELICAIIIANYASVDDTCFPGMARIAEDCRCTVRHVREVIRRLEEKNVLRIVRGRGRGKRSFFEFIKAEEINTLSDGEKGKESTPFTDEEKGKKSTPFPDDKRGTFAPLKEEPLCSEKGNFCVSTYKEEPLREPGENPPAETAGEAGRSAPDPLTEREAVETRRRYVPKSPDTEAWLTAMAPLVGAKSAKTLFNSDSWRRTIDDLIRDGYELIRFLAAVKAAFAEHQGDRIRYFGPNAVLKQLQLGSVSGSAAPVTISGGRVIPAGIDPFSGQPWTS
jgi:hypothetical protein